MSKKILMGLLVLALAGCNTYGQKPGTSLGQKTGERIPWMELGTGICKEEMWPLRSVTVDATGSPVNTEATAERAVTRWLLTGPDDSVRGFHETQLATLAELASDTWSSDTYYLLDLVLEMATVSRAGLADGSWRQWTSPSYQEVLLKRLGMKNVLRSIRRHVREDGYDTMARAWLRLWGTVFKGAADGMRYVTDEGVGTGFSAQERGALRDSEEAARALARSIECTRARGEPGHRKDLMHWLSETSG